MTTTNRNKNLLASFRKYSNCPSLITSLSLKKRLKELTKHMNDVKSSIEKVTKAKEDKCKEIENFVENIQHKLNTKLKNKLLTLLNQR
jgi:hypothetical protein